MNSATRNKLFGGLDLAVLNIMRSRDWGMARYSDFVEFCFPQLFSTGETLTSFDQLVAKGLMTTESAEALEDVYKYSVIVLS